MVIMKTQTNATNIFLLISNQILIKIRYKISDTFFILILKSQQSEKKSDGQNERKTFMELGIFFAT